MSVVNSYDFHHIVPRNGNQHAAFEEFCCQIARRSPDVPVGSEFIRYRGDGGDGGVECILRFPNGDEWGWQAKYIFDLTKANSDLDKSVTSAIAAHPRLTHYTICLPFDLTGPTNRKTKNGTNTRSQREVFETCRQRWIAQAQAAGIKWDIELATPATLLDDLLSFDPTGGRLKFWFDATILGDAWFSNHLDAATKTAGLRYTPYPRLETPIIQVLDALGLTDDWFTSLKERVRQFRHHIQHWNRLITTNRSDPAIPQFPTEIRTDADRALALLVSLEGSYQQVAKRHDISLDLENVTTTAVQALELFREIRSALDADLEGRYGEGMASSVSFRQFQAEYQANFPAANLDTAVEIIAFLEDFAAWIVSPAAKAAKAGYLLVLGGWGAGKTFAICDVAGMRQRRSLRTIVLFGEQFSGTIEPWEQVRQLLGFAGTFSRDTMLAALDAAAETSGKPLLICIDGLNETRPRSFWRNHLPAFIQHMRQYRSLRLCVSCRSTYEEQVVPSSLRLNSFVHEGFIGEEYQACLEFFRYYNLEPPLSPILQPEFSNPLFLRLVCEAMKTTDQKRIPSGLHGINTVITTYLHAKNKEYAEQHDFHASHRIPERALMAFVTAAEENKRVLVPWSEASDAIDTALSPFRAQSPVIDWLVREGMLAVDASTGSHGDNAEDQVRITFERLGDHLLANRLLEGLSSQTVTSAFQDTGVFSFAISSVEALQEYQGLLEALSIQIPERFGIELPHCVSGKELCERLTQVTVTSLPWRDAASITESTGKLLYNAFTFSAFSDRAFDAVISIAVHPSPVDAIWLHQLLKSYPMPERDGHWCPYLHFSFERHGAVARMLRTAFEVDAPAIPLPVMERWAICLLWFCAAADRRVRDRATKALVRLTESHPEMWEPLIRRFSGIDDEYILERCLAVTYGTLLRTREPVIERRIAQVVFEEIFSESGRFQNALIRDHARSILELAQHDGVLPDGIAEKDYMPPYHSDWPLVIPSVQEIEQFKESYEAMPRLYHSCMTDDFFTYILSDLEPYEHKISGMDMARWVFQHILDIGYPDEGSVRYDRYMVGKYGSGRGRPMWAERIGKKYQWIAIARLAARLGDHIKPKRDRWEPKPSRLPLVYEQGRDIDPSLLINQSQAAKIASWWMPVQYDFNATISCPDLEWKVSHEDFPDTAQILAEHSDGRGQRWVILEAYPDWTSKSPDMNSGDEYRLVKLDICSYLIPLSKRAVCWEWLRKQQFVNIRMPGGAEFSDGFVGEYPWATMFNLFRDEYHSRGDNGDGKLPCRMYPTCNTLLIEKNRNAAQEETINLRIPARKFFEASPLYWDGVSGYCSPDGNLKFLDPSLREPGPSVLLVDIEYLKSFLEAHSMALVWAIYGVKHLINYPHGDPTPPRLAYSRAHILAGGNFKSSVAIISLD